MCGTFPVCVEIHIAEKQVVLFARDSSGMITTSKENSLISRNWQILFCAPVEHIMGHGMYIDNFETHLLDNIINNKHLEQVYFKFEKTPLATRKIVENLMEI